MNPPFKFYFSSCYAAWNKRMLAPVSFPGPGKDWALWTQRHSETSMIGEPCGLDALAWLNYDEFLVKKKFAHCSSREFVM
jgi:hypothetical protein